MTFHPRVIRWRLGRLLGFSKHPKQAEFRARGAPAHISPARRRGDGFGPTGQGASLAGRQHPTSTTPGLRARTPLHKGRDSAWPSPPRAPRPAPSPGLRPRPGRRGGEEGKGPDSPGRSARRPRGAPRAPHLPVAPATCPSRPQPDHSRPTLTAPAPRQPAKAPASSRLLRLAAARASGGRALTESNQSRRTAARIGGEPGAG